MSLLDGGVQRVVPTVVDGREVDPVLKEDRADRGEVVLRSHVQRSLLMDYEGIIFSQDVTKNPLYLSLHPIQLNSGISCQNIISITLHSILMPRAQKLSHLD